MEKMPEGTFTKSDLDFLEPYIGTDVDEKTETLIVKVLCKFGGKVADYVERIGHKTSKMKSEVMRIAEKQDDADTILKLVSEEDRNVNDAVLALKRMGRTEYLTMFLFSDNPSLVSLVQNVAQ